MRTVACIGAGTVGSSWATVFARAGLEVRVHDEDGRRLERLRGRPGIETTSDLGAALDGVDYVQESVPEDLAVKRAVFAALDRLAPPGAVLASSASALPMSEIARDLARPERCLVAHPLNPPHVIPLVEIVPGPRTDPAVADAAFAFMERLGQQPILCRKEIHGFVANRLQMALFREALYL